MILASHGIIGSQIVQATGLLIEYPGAAAAYSLRLLRSTYTGSAIKVRRASDNTEQDIGFVNNELDTTSLASFCSGTNGFVTTWYDQSGNGNDATQSTAASQSQIVSSGSVILENGKPCVQFDGSSDYYSISINLGTINNFSQFIVNKYISGITFIGINDGNYGSVDRVITRQQSGNFVFAIRNTTSGNNANIGTVAINTNQHILTSIYNGSGTSVLAIDGISETSNTSTFGSMTLSDSLDISAIDNNGSIQEYGQNNIQEVILYPSDQSSNRTGIETNINAQYQIYWDGSQTSLLDTYSGSAAAYSLRALNSAYIGPLVEVRRASDNATIDVYAKYDGTLNVDALESFCSGTNGFVTTWYDQSGNGRDATQTTAANQPQIVSSGSVILRGGKPSVFGDGTNDYLQYSDTNFPTGDISFDLFHVEEFTDTPNNFQSGLTSLSAQTYVGDRRNISFAYQSTSNATFLYGGNTIYTTLTNTFQLNNINYQGGGGAIGARINASNLAVSSFNNTGLNMQSNTNFRLFSGQDVNTSIIPKQGYISEAIYYFSDQSSNRTGIETNINNFYSIY